MLVKAALRHIHFIGIGGIGVSGIAHLASKEGWRVSGSDIKESANTRRLESLGISVEIGHDPKYVEAADLVVYSSAIPPDNPELRAARVSGIPLKKRAEFLAELMADKKVITVTGAHGKTTTSSLAAELLVAAGLEPTVAVGGILRQGGGNARFSRSDYFVAEADESDGSFLFYNPTYSIITNIDYEHMDYYKTYDNLLKTFGEFVGRTKETGCLVYCRQDDQLRRIVKESGLRSLSFGLTKEADFYPQDVSLSCKGATFTCFKKNQRLGGLSLSLVGRHNVLNALAVVALGDELGLDFEVIRLSLSGFKGVERRFQVKYESQHLWVVDDYAHHPTEVQATIKAAKICSAHKLYVIFQPHRYSRTERLMACFPESFVGADQLIITDIYAAGEDAIDGVNAKSMVEYIKGRSAIPVDYVAKNDLVSYLERSSLKDGLVLFLGAGDITKVSDAFVRDLKKDDPIQRTS